MNLSPGSTRSTSTHSLGLIPDHAISWLVLLAAFAISNLSLADEQTISHQALDGMSFQSKLGPMGRPADTDDLLVFKDGYFVSEECARRCGYAKVEYWVRAHDDGIQMRAEVPCSKSDAVMYWRGTVRGDEIEGSFTWVNKRWYWTFEKEFSFKGRLVETNSQ
ncbi:hypothetical protein DXI23_10035 [Marinobacter flavimaris]|jgi:hypothetical protein|uniref:Uncharacterized protein n=1 Tax=Marinobacter flavimaris TaxID=262076 RepID=A0A3D8H2D5_9GAMM|nr:MULTISPECIES: hypothetical protein [Marinobacter]AKV95465.1 hypothetical protein ACP86_04380 [Marinobacter sp. CP1]PPI80434.1 hypothetical protein MDHKLMBL_08940 [Marinobacter flavimaris]RDU40873.1 hypothetical protein DXI23_10035 [Marinobacter flavimaris]|tara:strand:- start:745 stop:1233 length:489 start_codon:yes stop_codon:yes gene_type:complete